MIKIHIVFLLCTILMMSCKFFSPKSDDRPLAKVSDRYLFSADVANIISEKVSKEDSTEILRAYIDKWIKKQLILNKAELNLTEEEKNVNKLIEDYRSSLIIYKYEDKWLAQNLDTSISMKEIEAFYTANNASFILEEDIVRVLYIKIPKSAPNVDKIQLLYRDFSESNLSKLEEYCYQYAKTFDYCTDYWLSFRTFSKSIPITILDQSSFLSQNKTFEVSDQENLYLVNILEYKSKGTIAPLSFVTNRIKNVILNKRRIKMLEGLESSIYTNALNRELFKIY